MTVINGTLGSFIRFEFRYSDIDLLSPAGPRVCGGEQSYPHYQLRRKAGAESLGGERRSVSYVLVAGSGEPNNF